ncbi:hypothetical protein PINS_up016149 [Pythium insidiosum]|nr:hypothetical protein PINS_up016149 [Pythium insidiosum]
MVAQHAEDMRNERRRAEAATIRHEQAILNLVGQHRQEVAERLDMVLDQNKALFKRISTAIQELWSTRGTTRPSLEKEHWFLLARDDADASEDPRIVTFRIHSGQKAYIDKIGREKDVVLANPAANGIDIRQTTKKRMRALVGEEEDFKISALRFSCCNPDKLDGFLALLFESIDAALSPPSTFAFDSLQEETSKNLRDAFKLDNLFVGAAVAA